MGIFTKKTNNMTVAEIKKASEAAYAAQVTRNENLVAALEAGKLKSPRLIAEAKAIKAENEKKKENKSND